MELYIIRHGQSQNNVTMLTEPYTRVADPALSELGQQQAQAVARHLAQGFNVDVWVEQPPEIREKMQGFGLTRLYCSPMLRTLQTAQPIGQALDLPVEVWVDIHEHGGIYVDQGDERGVVCASGLTRSAMLTQFAGYVLPEAITDQGWWPLTNGIEDIPGCQARALKVAHTLRLQAGSAQRIALVTHGTFATCLIKAFLNLLPSDTTLMHHYNTGISRLDFRADGRIYIRYLNRIDHLPPNLVS